MLSFEKSLRHILVLQLTQFYLNKCWQESLALPVGLTEYIFLYLPGPHPLHLTQPPHTHLRYPHTYPSYFGC